MRQRTCGYAEDIDVWILFQLSRVRKQGGEPGVACLPRWGTPMKSHHSMIVVMTQHPDGPIGSSLSRLALCSNCICPSCVSYSARWQWWTEGAIAMCVRFACIRLARTHLYLTANFPLFLCRLFSFYPLEWDTGKSRGQLATLESGFMRISGNAPKGLTRAISGRSAKSTDVGVETHRLNAEAKVAHIPGDSRRANFFSLLE